jgi:hypothetical protein
MMSQNNSKIWFSIAGVVGILFGIFYGLFGLVSFPAYNVLVPKEVIIPWSNGLYGSTFIGFSVLLFFVGRHAFKNNDQDLMKALLYGIYAWLIVEALFSLYYGVYFNIAVDIALAVFFGFPLVKGIQLSRKEKL